MQILKSSHQYKEAEERLNQARNILATSEKLLGQYQALYNEGGLPENELRMFEQKVIEQRGNLSALEQEVQAREIELDQAQQQPEQIVGNYQKELMDRLSEHERKSLNFAINLQNETITKSLR